MKMEKKIEKQIEKLAKREVLFTCIVKTNIG